MINMGNLESVLTAMDGLNQSEILSSLFTIAVLELDENSTAESLIKLESHYHSTKFNLSKFKRKFVIDGEGPRWGPTGENMGEFKDTVVFVGDVFYYLPFSSETENEPDLICEFRSPDGTFTAGEILDKIFECEKEHRPNTHWIDSPDYTHIQFEGFFDREFDVIDYPEWVEKFVWTGFWGS